MPISRASAPVIRNPRLIPDDVLLKIGSDGDGAIWLNSAILGADAEVTGGIVGTSDHSAYAANSLLISNITASGDIASLVNNGGNSLEWLFVDASARKIHLGFGGFDTVIPGDPALGTLGTYGLHFGTGVRLVRDEYDTHDLALISIDAAKPFTRFRVSPLEESGGGDLAEISVDASDAAAMHDDNFGRIFLEATSTRFYIGQENRGTFTALPFQWQVVGRTATGSEDNAFWVLPGDATHSVYMRFSVPTGFGTNIPSTIAGVWSNSLVKLDQDHTNLNTYANFLTVSPAFTENASGVNNGNVQNAVYNLTYVRVGNTKNWTATVGFRGFYSQLDFSTATNVYTVTGGASFYAANATNKGTAVYTNQYGLYIEALTAGTNNYGIYINAPTGTIAEAIHIAGGNVNLGAGSDIVLATTTGTKIGTATNQLLGFYNATPVDQPAALTAQLTAITFTAPGTPDYALQDVINTNAYGFADAEEARTFISVVSNLQTRVEQLEDRLQELGLIA